MAVASSLLATIRSVPPQWTHVLTSMLKTRLRRCAKGHRAALFVGAAVVAVGPRRLRVRRRTFAAPDGVSCARNFTCGTKTPWKRVSWALARSTLV